MKYNDEFIYFLELAKEIEGTEAKIVNGEEYLEKTDKDKRTIGFVAEYVAEMYRRTGRPRPAIYQKAASAWEMFSVFTEEKDKRTAREALKRAYVNYKNASRFYRKEENYGKSEEMRVRAQAIMDELSRMSSPLRKIAVSFIFIVFLFSFMFLLSPPTGYAVVSLDNETTSVVGVILAVLGVIGTIIVILKK